MNTNSKFDVVGKKFGRLLVTGFVGTTGKDKYRALCKCDCGAEKSIYVYSILSGDTTSCGCYNSERTSAQFKTHGMRKAPEYNVWSGMKKRCFNKNDEFYRLYGGRGITVCREWTESFETFYRDLGPRPEGATLDRIDPNGNYEPSNCRWVTGPVQARNKTNNIMIELDGKRMCAAEWAREQNVPYQRLLRRIRHGWSPERALTAPMGG